MSKSWNPKQDEIDKSLKVHGHYTEGFYENELDRLFKDVKK